MLQKNFNKKAIWRNFSGNCRFIKRFPGGIFHSKEMKAKRILRNKPTMKDDKIGVAIKIMFKTNLYSDSWSRLNYFLVASQRGIYEKS